MVIKKPYLLLMVSAALVSGCASIPADRGMSDVRNAVAARGGPQLPEPVNPDQPPALPGRPFSVEDAVQVALVRNPQLRKGYAQLGLSGADVYEAGRLANPRLSLTVMDPSGVGAANQITMGLAQNFTNLLMMPMRGRIAQGEFERAKAFVGHDILRLTMQVQTAYYHLVSAQQVVAMRRVVARAARASADLAQRFHDAGNLPQLQLQAERAAASQAALELLEAQRKEAEARAALGNLLGLPATGESWTVPAALPRAAGADMNLAGLQQLASANRLDLAAARKEVELLRAGVKLTKRFRYFSDIEIGVEHERDTDRSKLIGPTLSLAVPIFNQNQAGVLRATSVLEQGQAELDALEIAVSNDVQLAYQRLLNAQARVEEFRTRLVPAREKVVARMQERVNYMLDGVFDLLRLKQEEYAAYQGYLEAVRDYWVARAELGLEVAGDLPAPDGNSSELVEPLVPAADDGGAHRGHGSMPGMDMGPPSTPDAHESPNPAPGQPDGGGENQPSSGAHHHH